MRSRSVVLALALSAASLAAPIRLAALAQGKQAAFEVASIKVNASGSENFGFTARPSGVMVATNVSARQIVTYAYSMQNSRVEGGPDWLDTVKYDIAAKASEAATQEQMLLMFRTLLGDRFKLVMHIDARDTPIFALVRARTDGRLGPQLRVTSIVDCEAARAAQARGAAIAGSDGRPICGGRTRAGLVTAGAVSMDELARNMSRLVGRVIVDRTGLPGRYDFDLKFTPEGELTAAASDRGPDTMPSLYVALEEQLGLKLEPQRAPVNVVVIDSIQRPVED
jgi:uncharacterized protein (TIGR03435 family)